MSVRDEHGRVGGVATPRGRGGQRARGRIALFGALVVTAVCWSAPPGIAASAVSGDGWVATATGASDTVAGGAQLTPVAPGDRVDVTVTLRVRDRVGLDALLVRQRTPGSSDYQRWLTPAEFVSRFAPSADEVAPVVTYLRESGFTAVTVAPNRLAVSGSAPADRAARAFATTLATASVGGRHVRVNTTRAMVPARLGGVVQAVLGLGQHAATVHPLRRPPSARSTSKTLGSSAPQRATPGGLYPEQIGAAYSGGSVPTGSATPVAVIAVGGQDQVVADLRTAERRRGLAEVPVSVVYVGTRGPAADGNDLAEFTLDTQTATAVAGSVSRLTLYTAETLFDDKLLAAWSRFVTDNTSKALSISIGLCESAAKGDGEADASDQVFAQALSQGQTIFAASGDSGSLCPFSGDGKPQTNFPASSRYVVAVGGTALKLDADGGYGSETAWGGSGGGLSKIEAQQPWQANATRGLGKVRGVPDVAADAAPETGALVVVNGAEEQIGGTSLAAPVWLGVWARVESALGNRLGGAAPLLYSLYDRANPPENTTFRPAAGFHDITTGSNDLYAARPGYDLVTGIGSPIVSALTRALGSTGSAAKELIGTGSGRCAAISGASRADRATVVLADCTGQDAQLWTTTSTGTLVVSSTGKCLDVRGQGTADGTPVQQYTCSTGNQAQQWTLQADHLLRNPRSGKCLDATKRGTAAGTPLQIWSCNPSTSSGANQRWSLTAP